MSNSDEKIVVEMQNVYKSYFSGKIERKVLTGANLSINEGDFIVIFGPSGCGKTTLLNIIGALDKANSGEVWVDGVNLSKVVSSQLADIRREKIGFVFQFFNLISNLTALENVELGLEAMGMKGEGVRERSLRYLEKVGLNDEADKFTEQLSGGEQQRVAIARALAKEPKLVLADEPTGNLDEENAIRIAEFMTTFHRDLGTTFVVVTHNQTLAQMADKVYYISKGRLMGA
jgi:putative ABC transport system ATP-binding protein